MSVSETADLNRFRARSPYFLVPLVLLRKAYREAGDRARMSTFQHDELLTQSEILGKETLPPAKEADRHAGVELDEAHHVQDS
jgi:hypothetical protein